MTDRTKDGIRPARLESGIDVKPVYGPEDVESSGGWDSVGNPGVYPFTIRYYYRSITNDLNVKVRGPGLKGSVPFDELVGK